MKVATEVLRLEELENEANNLISNAFCYSPEWLKASLARIEAEQTRLFEVVNSHFEEV